MSTVLEDMSPPAVVTAIEANFFEFGQLTRHWPRAEVHDTPELLWWTSGISHPLFNSAMRAELAPEKVDATINMIVRCARERGTGILWWTGPGTRPTDLEQSLEARGFTHGTKDIGMAMDLSTLPLSTKHPTGLEIECVDDEDGFRQCAHVATVAFEMPGDTEEASYELFSSICRGSQGAMRFYIGRLHGEPVACAGLLLGKQTAGLHCVATLPSARRRGIGTAITLIPLQVARSAGYHMAILSASEMGHGVYEKLGFRDYCKLHTYSWNGEPPTQPEA